MLMNIKIILEYLILSYLTLKGYHKSESFDHNLLNNIPGELNKMIAGNIQIDDIHNLKYKDYIIDLSGALETEEGKKDINKIDKLLNLTVKNMKLKKGIPVIDQGNKLGFWGGKFGGNFVPETLKKPIEDLEILFNKLKKDKKFINERDKYFKNWVGSPTSFYKTRKFN